MNDAVRGFFAKELEERREEGRREGLKLGREEAAEELEKRDRHRVLKMYEKGRPLEEIADDMELSLETVSCWVYRKKTELG